ncbi:MAG: hypothetical protein SFX72_18375 [Isosphaeraceae bacterium]|nr:hypothetical protein [Isosphaeraceae bacterium]
MGISMSERYWLIHLNGCRQLIDPDLFDLDRLAVSVARFGARLEIEPGSPLEAGTRGEPSLAPRAFEPPISALEPLFRRRAERIHPCRVDYHLQLLTRPTSRMLGNYYRSRSLIRLYLHDRESGRRPTSELFETFLHELAHHLEYTEFDNFDAEACGRRRGTMHSALFWRIFGELKRRWVEECAGCIQEEPTAARASGSH